MVALLLITIYVIALAWIILDGRVNRGKASATSRIGAVLWGSTGAEILAFLVIAWWFIRSVVGLVQKLLSGSGSIQPTYAESDRAKEWVVFPQMLIAFGFTGRGSFEWTA